MRDLFSRLLLSSSALAVATSCASDPDPAGSGATGGRSSVSSGGAVSGGAPSGSGGLSAGASAGRDSVSGGSGGGGATGGGAASAGGNGGATSAGGNGGATGGNASSVGGSSAGGSSNGGSGGGGVAGGGQMGIGGSTTSGCNSADILCEGFESYAADSFPTGAPWQSEGESCQFQAAQFLNRVSAGKAKSGKQSFKLHNKSFAACRLVAAIGDHDEFWVKAHIWWDTAISFMDRETIALDLATSESITQPKDDPAVRFGFRTKAPCTQTPGPQVTIIGFGEEATGCGEHPIPQGKWYCLEAHVTQTGGKLSVKTYMDGQSYMYKSIGKDPVERVFRDTDKRVEYLRVGIFSTSGAEGDAYVDDLAVSSTRVGCN